MQLEILLLLFISVLCSRTDRSTQLQVSAKKLPDEGEDLEKAIVHPLVNKYIQHDYQAQNVSTIEGGNDHQNEMKITFFKRSIKMPRKEEEKRKKRFVSNAIDLKGIVAQSISFCENPPKRDVYVYNEMFSPWEYSDLRGNYFNSWFNPTKFNDEEDHMREKRYPQLLYKGYPEDQFTLDNIEEYINLKTGKRSKRKLSALEKAFEQLEKDITELAKLKSMKILNSNKLGLNMKKDSIVNSRIPPDVQNLNSHPAEEVIRVYVPKMTKKPKSIPTRLTTYGTTIQVMVLQPNIQEVFKNITTKSPETRNSPLGYILSYNSKLNKTNPIEEDAIISVH